MLVTIMNPAVIEPSHIPRIIRHASKPPKFLHAAWSVRARAQQVMLTLIHLPTGKRCRARFWLVKHEHYAGTLVIKSLTGTRKPGMRCRRSSQANCYGPRIQLNTWDNCFDRVLTIYHAKPNIRTHGNLKKFLELTGWHPNVHRSGYRE
jgi:hypothetical protein